MSKSYTLPTVNGTTTQATSEREAKYHHLALRVTGTNPQGTLVISGRVPGSDTFEDVQTFDLSSLNTYQFFGSVAVYQFELSGVSGLTALTLTDTTGYA